jgi:hypothetical protein
MESVLGPFHHDTQNDRIQKRDSIPGLSVIILNQQQICHKVYKYWAKQHSQIQKAHREGYSLIMGEIQGKPKLFSHYSCKLREN